MLLVAVPACPGQTPRLLDRTEHEERLRGFWLGQCIANWTGRRSEGIRIDPPFPTDADWGSNLGNGRLEFILDQDPWKADDDTDLEYVTLHLLTEHGTESLTGPQIAQGWLAHIDRDFVWVSNERALDLMGRGLVPPETGLGSANEYWLFIDPQLTTEFFGLLNPGSPVLALERADLPVRNTSRGHAAHAAQLYIAMHALAPLLDRSTPRESWGVWLVERARAHLPPGSKALDIASFVLADYLANSDKDDWERTRDKVYERYQRDDDANGFRYRGWTESSVNLGTGLIALLYGEGDYLRTIQIGTLSGWDSDNGTATMGGLLGFVLGEAGLTDQIRESVPDFAPSMRYDIARTHDNLPDYLPDDPVAQDTFAIMAARMIPIVERGFVASGALVDGDRWLLPPIPGGDPLLASPLRRLWLRSANNQVRAAGGSVSVYSSVNAAPPPGYGSQVRARLANGFELDDSGVDTINNADRAFYCTLGSGQSTGDPVELRVTYDRSVEARTLVLVEGDHFDDGTHQGGWFESPVVEVLVGAVWMTPPGGFATLPALDPDIPFQILEWELAEPVMVTGVRVMGGAGGSSAFVTCSELDVLSETIPAPRGTYDLNADGRVDGEDLYTFHAAPVDLDGDGSVDGNDRRVMHAAARWREDVDMRGGGD